ncbi:hypothetical protein [Rhizobium ruizarguesonis]|uniref:hypothetical protein n=1 Tax=Rhizobium ruizarguesonis TaxID=2081791 RepID=UPI00102F36CD|nr:hypothetical protein [Rhizobium ruizarguesonis]TBE22885.1 hypothetical protein ELH08_08250 [Rhizobium ruizarguesonis]
MKFPNLSRVGQLRKHLKSTLNELGVQAKLDTHRTHGELLVYFQNSDGTVFAPVWISVPDMTTDGWEGCELLKGRWSKYEVGHNGWTFYRDLHYISEETLGADSLIALEKIRAALLSAGPVLTGKHPTTTSNQHFMEAAQQLDDRLILYDDVVIECRRENGVESFNFEDPCGRTWRISFEEGKAIIQLDGEEFSTLPWDQSAAIATLVSDEVYDAVVTRDAGLD